MVQSRTQVREAFHIHAFVASHRHPRIHGHWFQPVFFKGPGLLYLEQPNLNFLEARESTEDGLQTMNLTRCTTNSKRFLDHQALAAANPGHGKMPKPPPTRTFQKCSPTPKNPSGPKPQHPTPLNLKALETLQDTPSSSVIALV